MATHIERSGGTEYIVEDDGGVGGLTSADHEKIECERGCAYYGRHG